MWLSQLVELLNASRAAVVGPTTRRAGRPRPLVVEPLEDRLVLTGGIDLDVAPASQSRPQPSVIMTFVMGVAGNWFDMGWSEVNDGQPKPGETGSKVGTNRRGNGANGPKNDAVSGLDVLPVVEALGLPTGAAIGAAGTGKSPVAAGPSAAVGSSAAAPLVSAANVPLSSAPAPAGSGDAGPATPAQIDTLFQQWLAAGSV